MKTNNIKSCGCGESEFVRILPKFNKHQVFCVNCGNTGQAMSTKDKAILSWNESGRNDSILGVE